MTARMRVAAWRRARRPNPSFEEHQEIAFRTAYVITGSAAEAEEAAQEAYVRAWLALRRFRRAPSFALAARDRRQRGAQPRAQPPAARGLAERAAGELSGSRQLEVPPARATAACARRSRCCRNATAA